MAIDSGVQCRRCLHSWCPIHTGRRLALSFLGWRWSRRRSVWLRRSTVHHLQLVMNTGLCDPQVLLIRQQPFLIRILERRRERRHDLAAVSKISSNFCPSLALAYCIKASFTLDGLFEAIQVKRTFIDRREAVEVVAILLVKSSELIEIVVVDPVPTFDGVQFLTTGAEVETLFRPHISLSVATDLVSSQIFPDTHIPRC